MNIAVLVKPTPGADSLKLDPATNFTDRSAGVKLVLDPSDAVGVERALQLRDESGEGEVVIFGMSPSHGTEAHKSAMAMGADRAVLVTDDQLVGADSLLTARVLAKAIARSSFDLVIAGTESSDGYTGTLPAQLAELLDVPSLTFATEINVANDEVVIKRQTEQGYNVVSAPLPALVTLTAGVLEPRYPSFKGIMAAKSKPQEILSVADLGLSADELKVTQTIVSVTPAPERSAGRKVVDEGQGESAQEIVLMLDELKII